MMRQLGHDMADIPFPLLNSQQAESIVERMNEVLGPEVAAMISASGLNPNHMVRFLSLASLCRRRRQEIGLSLKDVSQRLKIPQYRLKAVESGMIPQLTRGSLDAYIQILGLADQFAQWRDGNEDVWDEIAKDAP